MKNLVLSLTVIAALTSNTAFANGGKIPPPSNLLSKSIIVADNGGKIPPPTGSLIGGIIVAKNGGKIPPPTTNKNVIISDNGGKIPPPTGDIVASDSGVSSLSHLLSKYFGF